MEENKTIENANWKQNEPLGLAAVINDTISKHNFYINVRHNSDYQYSNLFLFVRMVLPDKRIAIDTVECTLATPEGKWLGSGLGDIYDTQILYRRNFVFPQSGNYQFFISQAMRIDPLINIKEVGLRIEKADQ